MKARFLVIAFYNDSPEEKYDTTMGFFDDSAEDLARHELDSMGEGWNKVEVYEVPASLDGVSDYDIDSDQCDYRACSER